jgi:HAD superfamily hydrolase (TIGR01509 family)
MTHAKLQYRPNAVMLDLDGTLLDTERLYAGAFFAALAGMGLRMEPGRYEMLIGHGTPNRRMLLSAWYGPDFPLDAFLARYRRLREAQVRAHGVFLRSGGHALLTCLEIHGIPFAIVTSASKTTALRRLRQAGIANRCRVVITRDDVTHGKPHPESLLLAAQRLQVRPATCLVVEDSLVGLLAAQQAEMQAVLVGSAVAGHEVARATLSELAVCLQGPKHQFHHNARC